LLEKNLISIILGMLTQNSVIHLDSNQNNFHFLPSTSFFMYDSSTLILAIFIQHEKHNLEQGIPIKLHVD